jgi:hypothetical protein
MTYFGLTGKDGDCLRMIKCIFSAAFYPVHTAVRYLLPLGYLYSYGSTMYAAPNSEVLDAKILLLPTEWIKNLVLE